MSILNLTLRAPAPVANLSVSSGVRAASLMWGSSGNVTDMYEVWANTINDSSSASIVSKVQSNSFSLGGVTIATYFWVRVINATGTPSTFGTSVFYTPSVITSTDTTNTPASSISSGVSASTSSTTVSGYESWTSAGHAGFNASDNSIVTISMAMTIDITSIAGTGVSGSLEVQARSRLYDVTDSVDVPGGTKTYLLFSQFLSTRGSTNQIFNVNESFISGFRGLLTPGHDYELHVEALKHRAVGTPTATVSLNASVTSSGAAAI